jgi:phosphate transport system protein
MRSRFDEQLAALKSELITMGSLCEEAIAGAARALITGDASLAGDISALEDEIDRKERDIEAMCMRLLLQQQPVASDLRQISAALKMITDMERIGDQAEDIAEIIRFLGGRTGSECEAIAEMAQATIKMVTESVDAFVQQDVYMARRVVAHDDVVDGLFVEVRQSLIDMIGDRAGNGEYAIDLMMIAKYFERIGDHATNIAEWVEFAVTGVHKGESEL